MEGLKCCSIIITGLARCLRLSQERGAAQHQVANRCDDSGQILSDAKVLEANGDDSSLRQQSIALSVRIRIMVRAVQLDRDLRARTVEINDDVAERVLATNGNSQSRSAQLRPEDGFFRCRTPSELTRSIEHVT